MQKRKVLIDKYYQIAKPDEFLFTIKILVMNAKKNAVSMLKNYEKLKLL